MKEKNNNLVISHIPGDENKCIIYSEKNSLTNNDLNTIKKISNIKYCSVVELEKSESNNDGIFHKFIFDFKNYSNIKNAFIEFLKKLQSGNNFESDKHPLIQIIEYLKIRNNNNHTMDELKGDIGEALFILKCLELGKDILKFLRYKDDSLYDFYFDNKIFEIKTSSTRTKEIKINHSQMPNDDNNNLNIIICNVKYCKKSLSNHMTILDIYDNLSKKINFDKNYLLQHKKEYYESLDHDFIENNAIDINDYHFSKFKVNNLWKLKTEIPKGVKDLIYVIDVSNIDKLDDNQLLKLIK